MDATLLPFIYGENRMAKKGTTVLYVRLWYESPDGWGNVYGAWNSMVEEKLE